MECGAIKIIFSKDFVIHKSLLQTIKKDVKIYRASTTKSEEDIHKKAWK